MRSTKVIGRFAAGRSDRNRRMRNWDGSNIYRSGTYGWQSYVDRSQYRYYVRQRFERGCQDGFNSRYQYGTNNNGVVNILGSILGLDPEHPAVLNLG